MKRNLGIMISLLVAISFLLSACGPAATATTSPNQPAAAATTAPSKPKLDLQGYKGPALTDKEITLTFLRQSYGDAEEGLWKKYLAEWSAAYPNIKIQLETVPFGQLATKVIAAGATGSAPDIMMGQSDYTRNYAFAGLALPLNDYLTAEYINDYYPAVKEMDSAGGKTYLFPYEVQVCAIFWNKDEFQKAGIPEPIVDPDSNKTWTWEQWTDAFRKIKAYNDKNGLTAFALAPSGYGAGGPGSNYWHEGTLIRGYGDPNAPKDSTAYKTWAGVSEDGLTASGYVDTPEAIAAAKLYQSWFVEKLTPTSAMTDAWYQGFGIVNWTANSTIDKSAARKLDWKVGAAACPKGLTQMTHISGDAPFVSSKTKNPAEAVAFLTFLHNDANRLAWHDLWGSLPARQSLMAKSVKYNDMPYAMMKDELKYGAAAPLTPGVLEYYTSMNKALADIALGADPEKRLHEVANQIDSLLAKYKK